MCRTPFCGVHGDTTVQACGAGFEVPPSPWKTTTQKNGKTMNTTEQMNEEDIDPFAGAPFTVGVTNMLASMVPMAVQTMPTLAGKTKIAAEFQYAKMMESDSAVAKKDGLLYCWNASFWKLQADADNARHALLWLGKHVPQRAIAATAESCIRTALLLANPLPPKPVSPVVPVHGGWFTFNRDFSIALTKPNRAIGVVHCVPVQTTASFGSYVPAPVPADSLFGTFIESSLPDPAVRELVQTYVGYTLCSHVKYQVGHLWIGAKGSNGKSTMLNIVMALHEKAVAMQLDKLEGFNLSNLLGATLVACDETPKGKIDQQILKSLISGGTTSINRKFKDVLSYQSVAKFIICANHLPALTDQSDAFWRRLHVVEWNQTFTGDQIVMDLDHKIIQSELHIVLDWALAGLQKLEQKGKFIIPEASKQAVRSAKIESNNVTNWVESNEVSYSDVDQPYNDKAILYENYRDFCKDNGFQACAVPQFFTRLHSEFPNIKETRTMMGNGADKRRVRCINLTTGVFCKEDLVEQVAFEKGEIEQAFYS
jgi:putative DNA primase/helicase